MAEPRHVEADIDTSGSGFVDSAVQRQFLEPNRRRIDVRMRRNLVSLDTPDDSRPRQQPDCGVTVTSVRFECIVGRDLIDSIPMGLRYGTCLITVSSEGPTLTGASVSDY